PLTVMVHVVWSSVLLPLGCGSPDCNQVLQEPQGEFRSPCYPQKYPNSLACRWSMRAPAGFIIQLSFLDFDLEEAPGCIYDRVVVNTGGTDIKFCGLTADGLTLNSTGNVMELTFTSDFSIQKKGFYVSFRHVAVALRNQKVRVTGGNGQVTQVSSSVNIPTLSQLTTCLEVERTSQKQKEWFFTYYSSDGDIALSVGAHQSDMTLIIDAEACSINPLISQNNFTSTMKPFCITWASSSGQVGVYSNGIYQSMICSSLSGSSVAIFGGTFSVSSHHFDGFVYNFRLWDFALTSTQLKALTCDSQGNVIDWDNSYWDIPPTLAQTDATLSCSEYPDHGFNTDTWLNQTFGNWSHSVYIENIRYLFKDEFPVSLHYRWSESRPTVRQNLPCFPNKDQSASRTCMISPLNYSSFWSDPDFSNCTDIDSIQVSAENAAEVAVQLVDISNNELSNEEVSKVVTKVKELVNVAKINTTLAVTVVTIISNVMRSSEMALAATSEKALKAVDELVQKIEFEGPSVTITSKHLAVGISTLNATAFNGTMFSAAVPPNASDPQVLFDLDSASLAQVVLPASLLSNVSLGDMDRSSLSRINFMFFGSTALFQNEQDGLSLNSYVVASSVGNVSIRNLKEPVRIEIAHLTHREKPPVCMFWDFSLKGGGGGWNADGCSLSDESSSNRTVCLCDHMTHFGILMDISGSSAAINEQNTRILTFITYIGCGISAVFSAATLLTYIAFEKLRRDYPSKILMNLSSSLLFLNMCFLLDGWLASLHRDTLCVSIALLLHYFLLTSFTWMALESIHMYIALVKVFNTYIRRYILKFCLLGWGLPLVVVGIVAAVDVRCYGLQEYGRGTTAEGASEFCWIRSPLVFYVTCVGFFCLVFLLNVAMFIVVMMQICGRNGKRSNRTLREEVLRNLRSVVSLTFLLGMTWGFAFFAWGPVALAFMYLFAIFNSLQGLFIFSFHCALKENVQKQWRRYLCCGRFRLSDNSDWSKTATNNTKKVSSDNLGKSLSSSSFGSSSANWTSKAKATLNPFTKRHSNTG
uniref:Adhesion G-protein coupled receptor G6 n=1 Tax=Sphaeramia orbicularis TaxID=375764 RepID=A0A673BF43_9TELE